MSTVSLQGLTKTKVTKRQLKSILSKFKGVGHYNDFGDNEYKVYVDAKHTLAALDINTNEVWLNMKEVK